MKCWTMSENLITDLKVTALALSAVMTFVVLGFIFALAIPPILLPVSLKQLGSRFDWGQRLFGIS